MVQQQSKIILITGVSSGIGAACARVYAQHGWRIIATARRQDRIQALAAELSREYHVDVLPLVLDVTSREQVVATLQQLPEDWQHVHTLVNNAGLAVGKADFHLSDLDDFDQMIDTNIKGLIYVTHTLLPGMIDRGEGDIINIGSIAGHEVYPQGNVYASTKHAVHAITQGIRQDTVGKGIRVCSVDPGAVETEFSEVRFKGDKSKAKNVYQGMTPLTAQDIAEAIYFCSSRPRHVTMADILILPSDQASTTLIHRS